MKKINGLTENITILFLITLLTMNSGLAKTYVNKTRVIIYAHSKEETFNIINDGTNPALIQSWVDEGDQNIDPGRLKVPFIVLPPTFRLDAKKSHALRIIYFGNGRENTERLFWLNVLEVPTKKSSSDEINFQLAFRTRVKLLLRPDFLKENTIEDAVGKIEFIPTVDAKKPEMGISNRSPFFITLISVSFKDGMVLNNLPNDGLIAPFSNTIVNIPSSITANQKITSFEYVNDYGVIVKYNK